MGYGSWILRFGVFAIIYAIIGWIAVFNPQFVVQAGNAIFGSYLTNETSRTLAVYAIIFGVGTLIAFMAERDIKRGALDDV